jgi:copper chaperone CopZ
MKKFKTNIKCDACVAKVTPYLNESAGSGNWQVNLTDPQKTLTINSDVAAEKIQDALQKAGYKAEQV